MQVQLPLLLWLPSTGPAGVVDAGAVASSPVVFLAGVAGVVEAGAVASSPVVAFTGPAGVVDAGAIDLFSCGCLHRWSSRSGTDVGAVASFSCGCLHRS